MKFLVTGGAGFIGSHIVKRLVEYGGEVVALDNLSSGKIDNLNEVIKEIHFVEGDIRDLDLLIGLSKNVDYIFHESALTSVIESTEDPLKCNEINIRGTLNVFIAGLKNNVKRIIYASSSAVYGDSPVLPKKEDMKYVSELYSKFFCDIYHLDIISLRYFNVYGPRQDPFSPYSAVIPKFITSLLKDEPPTIYGDGKQTRDFIYVEDVVNANILAIEKNYLSNKIFNIATGRGVSIIELFEMISKIMNKKIEPKYAPPRKGEIKDSYADISLAKKELGFEPKFSLKEGLKRTIEWYLKIKS
ncbi:MAG: SDR family oxidoreductase [Dictyoglomaceae bacterium]